MDECRGVRYSSMDSHHKDHGPRIHESTFADMREPRSLFHSSRGMTVSKMSNEDFREFASSKGLTLTLDEAERIRTLVLSALSMMTPVRDILRSDEEPIVPSAAP